MASTTQEKIIPLDGMTFAEFADPSYFIFANRAAQKKQKKTITPGMTWKLYNDTMPEEEKQFRSHDKDGNLNDRKSPINQITDKQGEIIKFQDPWQGIIEICPRLDRKKGIFYGL